MSSTAIPLSEISLFPATKAQVLESRKRSFVLWGRGVTLEAYLARDARSDEHETSRDGRMVTWVLARSNNPESLEFLCSCETFQRDGVVVQSSSEIQYQSKQVQCYGIASVFTAPEHRRKGYAKHMMQLLHWVLAPLSALPVQFPEAWGQRPNRGCEDKEQWGNAAFSVLWSDVGSEFYARCGMVPEEGKLDGWVVRDPVSSGWEVRDLVRSIGEKSKGDDWEWLDERSVYEMWNVDAEVMKAEMMAKAKKAESDITLFAFLPDNGVAEFQVYRLQYFWEQMEPVPRFWGIRKWSKESTTFASWTLDVRPPEASVLLITRLRASPDEFEGLMREIAGFASRHGVERIEVWGLAEELRGKLGARTWQRDEHLPSVKWYGAEKHVLWCFNEKFCWC